MEFLRKYLFTLSFGHAPFFKCVRMKSELEDRSKGERIKNNEKNGEGFRESKKLVILFGETKTFRLLFYKSFLVS